MQIGMDGSVLKPAVIVFLDTTCDGVHSIAMKLNSISQQAGQLGMIFYGVFTGNDDHWKSVSHYAKEKAFTFPVILDGDGNLRQLLQPQAVPEAFILGKHSNILYQGGLVEISAAFANAKQDKVFSSNEKPDDTCDVSTYDTASEDLTYNQHIAGLIQANCVECHRQNGIAPFHLENYIQARNFGPVIAHVTKERIMPPWQADPGSGHYLNERLLSDHQIELIQNWVDQGAKEGKSETAIPPPNVNTSQWRLGPPDIVIRMPEPFDIPASGPDIYRYFVVENAIPEDLEIATVDFKPGDPSVVHHSNFFVDYGKKARKMAAKDPEPGFSVFGTGGFFSYWDKDNTAAGLGAWAPGGNPIRYPDGIGITLPGGADFVFEIHYHPTGKKTRDQSELGIYLADKRITKPVSSLFVGTSQVDIPAGAKDYQRYFWMELPAKMELVDIAPHMHYLGTRAEVDAVLPNGEKISLLKADWDFRWQGAYYYREPLTLPKGTKIEALVQYDNSSDNPYNPYDPPVRATWGWGTDQEMGELYLTVLTDSESDLEKLQTAARESWFRPSDPALRDTDLSIEEIILRVQYESTWEANGEALLGILIQDGKNLNQSISVLKKAVKDKPNEARLWMVYGSLLAVGSELAGSEEAQYQMGYDSIKMYEKALRLDDTLWDARLGLAISYGMDGSSYAKQVATQHFETLIEQQNRQPYQKQVYAKTYQRYGDFHQQWGAPGKARKIWAEGRRLFPGDTELHNRLGE